MNETLRILQRYSTPAKLLTDPAPDETQLTQILQAAMSAPDHGRIRPYRFISISGDARHQLSEVFGAAVRARDPGVSDDYVKKQMDKPLRSPLILVVVASLIDSPKVPHIEQMLSAGAAAHNVLLASNALGFGSIWLTGANAYDPLVRAALGLAENEHIIGFLYIGSEKATLPDRVPIEPDGYLSHWQEPIKG